MGKSRRVESTYGMSDDEIEVVGMVDECPVPNCEANGQTHEHVKAVVAYWHRKNGSTPPKIATTHWDRLNGTKR